MENNLARKEQELLEMLLQQRQSLSVSQETTFLEERMVAAEAEAAVSTDYEQNFHLRPHPQACREDLRHNLRRHGETTN